MPQIKLNRPHSDYPTRGEALLAALERHLELYAELGLEPESWVGDSL